MSKFFFQFVVILMIFWDCIELNSYAIVNTQNLAATKFPVVMEARLQQDVKTHLVNVEVIAKNSSKTLTFFGRHSLCLIAYTVQQGDKRIATYPTAIPFSVAGLACVGADFRFQLAPLERLVILQKVRLYNHNGPLARLKPGKYQFKGFLFVRGQIGTQQMSKFPLDPVTFTVK
jgi:hypothetical protein